MLIKHDPKQQLVHQLHNFYSIGGWENEIDNAYPTVMERLDYCFSYVKNKYYHNNGKTIFNPLHVAQWTMFLYTMANELSKTGNTDLCDMIYGLSKMASSADIFYEVAMPKIWFFDHPQGSVMGRAEYNDFFTFSQGCTVGNNKGKFPVFGKHVSMLSNSKVLGNCHVGDHVIIAANTYVIDKDIPSYSIVFGTAPNNTIQQIAPEKFNELTGSMFSGDED